MNVCTWNIVTIYTTEKEWKYQMFATHERFYEQENIKWRQNYGLRLDYDATKQYHENHSQILHM